MTVFTYLNSEEGFLGLKDKDAVLTERAKAAIVQYGLETSVSYGGGTKNGPAAIIEASHQVELFDEEFWSEPFRQYGIATLAETTIPDDLEAALVKLENIVRSLLDRGVFPMVLGGEHSLTAGAIRPFAEAYQDLVVLQFDAHADLRDGYEGQHYSHAAAMRRVLDYKHVNLVSVGIRNISAEEVPFLEANSNRIKIHWAKDKKNWSVDEIVAPLKGKPIYLTFDIDGFDSSLMPATGTPEPGGLFFYETLEIIKAASKAGTIVGADIVELAPMENLHACDFLAAKLAYKILSYALLKKTS